METVSGNQIQTSRSQINSKKPFLATFIVWTLLIILLSSILFFMKVNNYIPNNILALYSSDMAPIVQNEKNFHIYQEITDSSLRAYGVFYNIIGTVKEVNPTPEGNQIVMTISDTSLPPLLLTSTTKVFYGYNHFNFTGVGSLSDIKPSTYVRLVVYYSFKTNTWRLVEVYIPETNK